MEGMLGVPDLLGGKGWDGEESRASPTAGRKREVKRQAPEK